MPKTISIKRSNSIASKRPDLLDEWDWEKNGELGLDPHVVAATSGAQTWWKCKNAPHSYHVMTRNKTYNNQGCPVCAGKQIIVGLNDFAHLEPDLAAEWDYELNDRLPTEFSCGSHYRAHWICSTHGVKWSAEIKSRVTFKSGCSKCKSERITLNNSKPKHGGGYLADEYPEIAAEWFQELNGKWTPYNVASKSGRAFYFKCPACDNVYKSYVCNRTNLGEGCIKCGRARTGDINATPTEGKSLADVYPEIASQWDYDRNGDITPKDIKPYSGRKYHWVGTLCHHTWTRNASSEVLYHGNCPVCARGRTTSFPEKAVYYYILRVFGTAEENSHGPHGCLGRLSVDVWIPSISTAIEYDGGRWHKDAAHDMRKDAMCAKNGIRLIRIREPNCVEYESDATVVLREDYYSNASLNKAIQQVLSLVSCDNIVDVDVSRDAPAIRAILNSLPYDFDYSHKQLRLDLAC